MKIPVVDVGWLADNTVNYFDEEGRFVIAPNTPEHRQKRREWELREFGQAADRKAIPFQVRR